MYKCVHKHGFPAAPRHCRQPSMLTCSAPFCLHPPGICLPLFYMNFTENLVSFPAEHTIMIVLTCVPAHRSGRGNIRKPRSKDAYAMIRSYMTDNREIRTLLSPQPGSWIRLTKPTENEAQNISSDLDIDPQDLLAAADPEEKNRIELLDGYTLVIIDIPAEEIRHEREVYTTIPLGIIMTNDYILTVCSEETSILQRFADGKVKDFSTKKKLRLIYQIMMVTASKFQEGLRDIDRHRQMIEEDIGSKTAESDLIGLHELESTLVYFATSLRGNANVLNRLTRYERIEQYPEDRELLDDVIVENQQAVEMTEIYRGIIDSTRDLMSTILDKRLNNVMKILTSITIILAIPTLISGLYGMNLNSAGMPLSSSVHGFALICIGIAVICGVLAVVLRKLRML